MVNGKIQMNSKWYKVAGCVTAITVAAAASATAEERLQTSGVVVTDPISKISYDESDSEYIDYLASPLLLACSPNSCEPQGAVVPQMDMPNPVAIPELGSEVTQISIESSMHTTLTDHVVSEPALSSNAFAEALNVPIEEPAPLNFTSHSQSSSRSGFGSASAVSTAPAPGFIGYAPVRTRFRTRYDNAQGINDPTRGELLYPTPSAGLGQAANGPPLLGAGIGDVQLETLSFYLEYAMFERLSVFIDVPVRWVRNVDFTGNGLADRQNGFSDLRTGFKLALIAEEETFLTTQFIVSTPTGDARKALGTGNVSFDIGLLYQQQVSDDVYLYGEFRDWFTLDAPIVAANTGPVDLNSNILRFGAGVGVDLLDCGNCRCKPKKLTALFEVVGWTVLDGFSTNLNGSNIVEDAQGDTIINGQYGLRYTDGKQSIYVGYGHNWSSERLHSDLVRVQHSYFF